MANENYTHITFVVDRSGSMGGIAQAMREGFDEFMSGQLEVEGEATLSLARFDNEYELVYDFVEIGQVGPLELNPRGGTALLDGMGRTMNSVREQIMEMEEDERPSKCLFIFITDGHENASQEYTRDRVFQMIQDCQDSEELNYEFVFMGANQDAISAGRSFGIRQDASITYSASNAGVRGSYASLSRSVTQYRTKSSNEATMSFTDEDRVEAMGTNPIVPDLDTDIINQMKK
jgi:uncharacterized protein YegL